MSVEMVLAKKNTYFWAPNFHIEIKSIVTEFIILLCLYNVVNMQSMKWYRLLIQFVKFGELV